MQNKQIVYQKPGSISLEALRELDSLWLYLSKLDKDGKPIYWEDGKVIKSELYFKYN